MSALILSVRNLFLLKIPFYVLTITLIISFAAFYFFSAMKQSVQSAAAEVQTAQNINCYPARNVIRLKDYDLTRPVLISDVNCESEALVEIKGTVLDLIHQQQQYGNVSSISFYLKKFYGGDWTTINEEEQYAPGSLMKVPILITYLKQAETQPAILDKQIFFAGHAEKMPTQNFVEDGLIPGAKYKIRDLLERMIINSDNDAVTLLNNDLNFATLKKLFTDLNLSEPSPDEKDYPITAPDCAKFLRILYNSSYLDHDMSEYALDLLTQSRFKKGMIKNIPADIKVAHKFGESGTTGGEVQLHEEGIFYLDNNPYLLVVMTKGKDFDKMAESISAISNAVYNKFTGKALN